MPPLLLLHEKNVRAPSSSRLALKRTVFYRRSAHS
uniref:Uncharacterized protein n=1 Tax=Anopheles funestus TaxID=62324 RepID=A0A182S4G5_ANOFN